MSEKPLSFFPFLWLSGKLFSSIFTVDFLRNSRARMIHHTTHFPLILLAFTAPNRTCPVSRISFRSCSSAKRARRFASRREDHENIGIRYSSASATSIQRVPKTTFVVERRARATWRERAAAATRDRGPGIYSRLALYLVSLNTRKLCLRARFARPA